MAPGRRPKGGGRTTLSDLLAEDVADYFVREATQDPSPPIQQTARAPKQQRQALPIPSTPTPPPPLAAPPRQFSAPPKLADPRHAPAEAAADGSADVNPADADFLRFYAEEREKSDSRGSSGRRRGANAGVPKAATGVGPLSLPGSSLDAHKNPYHALRTAPRPPTVAGSHRPGLPSIGGDDWEEDDRIERKDRRKMERRSRRRSTKSGSVNSDPNSAPAGSGPGTVGELGTNPSASGWSHDMNRGSFASQGTPGGSFTMNRGSFASQGTPGGSFAMNHGSFASQGDRSFVTHATYGDENHGASIIHHAYGNSPSIGENRTSSGPYQNDSNRTFLNPSVDHYGPSGSFTQGSGSAVTYPPVGESAALGGGDIDDGSSATRPMRERTSSYVSASSSEGDKSGKSGRSRSESKRDIGSKKKRRHPVETEHDGKNGTNGDYNRTSRNASSTSSSLQMEMIRSTSSNSSDRLPSHDREYSGSTVSPNRWQAPYPSSFHPMGNSSPRDSDQSSLLAGASILGSDYSQGRVGYPGYAAERVMWYGERNKKQDESSDTSSDDESSDDESYSSGSDDGDSSSSEARRNFGGGTQQEHERLTNRKGRNYSSIEQSKSENRNQRGRAKGLKKERQRKGGPGNTPLRLDEAIVMVWEKLKHLLLTMEIYIANMPSLVGSLALSWSSLGVDWFKWFEETSDSCHPADFHSEACVYTEFPGCFACDTERPYYQFFLGFHQITNHVSLILVVALLAKIVIAFPVVRDELANPTTAAPLGLLCMTIERYCGGNFGFSGMIVAFAVVAVHTLVNIWFLYISVVYKTLPEPSWFSNTTGIGLAAVKIFLYWSPGAYVLGVLAMISFVLFYTVSLYRVHTNIKISAPVCWAQLSGPAVPLYGLSIFSQPGSIAVEAMLSDSEYKDFYYQQHQRYFMPVLNVMFAFTMISMVSALYCLKTRWKDFREREFSPAHASFCAPLMSHVNALQNYRGSLIKYYFMPIGSKAEIWLYSYWTACLVAGTILTFVMTWKFLVYLPKWCQIDVEDDEIPPEPEETMISQLLQKGDAGDAMKQNFVSAAVLQANESGALVRVIRDGERKYVRSRRMASMGFDPILKVSELMSERDRLLQRVDSVPQRERDGTSSFDEYITEIATDESAPSRKSIRRSRLNFLSFDAATMMRGEHR